MIQCVAVMEKSDNIFKMRHSLAHITAAAVQRLWPEAKFGVGPVVENGFYYDIDIPEVTISTDDFKRIEKEMRKIINEGQAFERSHKLIDEAIAWAKESQQPYKEELLNDLKRSGTTAAKDIDSEELGLESEKNAKVESVSFYQNGNFIDLCRGPHVDNTKQIGAFKLMRVAGAYWRGKEDNPQMQRIYGVAFETKEELDQYLQMLEEAKKRDHRKLGKELDLFVTSKLVGAGLPLFTPRGTILREELARYANELREEIGFEKVWIPHITKQDLYEASGHWQKFGDELFLVKSQETSDNFVMKPMNCPHHTQIYASNPRSYKDLPVRYLETTTVYRDEKSGELGGLSRVRSITQDDSHVFCREDQIHQEVNQLVVAARKMYETVGMQLKTRLSYRDDSSAYLGDISQWQAAQEQLLSAVKEAGMEYYEERGEAAFYGPKIDFMATDAIGREHQVATVQLDFVQPDRFSLEYTDKNGEKKIPVMIHAALLGSVERFLSVYIEHTAGRFPVWLAPEQLRVIQVKDSPEIDAFVDEIQQKATESGLRVNVDRSNESVGKKIRNAEVMKVPYTIVIGEKELETKQLTPRLRSDLGATSDSYNLEELVSKISKNATSRSMSA